MKVTFKVTLTKPPNATLTDVRNYIKEWVQTGRGSLYPGGLDAGITPNDEPDPMWDLDPDTVKVTHIKEVK